MKPAWKIMIALVLAVGLAAGGFLLGYQRMETYELSEPVSADAVCAVRARRWRRMHQTGAR